MNPKNTIRLFAIAATLGICPTLTAVDYTWNFSGSSVSGGIGNYVTFTNGNPVSIKATAWYIDSAGLFQKATIGRYSQGLGVCYPGDNCSNANDQTDNSGSSDFILLEFSAPIDPTTARVTTTSSTQNQRDTDVSFWLGGTGSSQNLDLTGTSVAALTGLGFGNRVDNEDNLNLARNGYRDVSIAPVGQYVNKMIFGAQYLEGDDFFKMTSLGGSTFNGGGGSVPEPSSIVLLGTVGAVVLRVLSKRARTTSAQPIQE